MIRGIQTSQTSNGEAIGFKKVAPTMSKDQIIVVSLSGRGDKEVAQAARMVFGEELKF